MNMVIQAYNNVHTLKGELRDVRKKNPERTATSNKHTYKHIPSSVLCFEDGEKAVLAQNRKYQKENKRSTSSKYRPCTQLNLMVIYEYVIFSHIKICGDNYFSNI